MKNENFIQLALSCGAAKAAVISSERIVTSATFREICKGNGCGKYDKCWVCPPAIGNIEELMETVYGYPKGLLYQTIASIEDSFDIEGMLQAGADHEKVSRRLHQEFLKQMPEKMLHLSCGGCRLCEKCAKLTGEPCRFPDLALPSMEGYGIDVYNTVKDTELKYINGQNSVTYFGLILFSE